jgi:fucose 4-O-acetylase-like acetyltransferase
MISITRDSIESRVLAWMRFPLVAMIVLIHTRYTKEPMEIAYYLGRLLEGISQIAVPAFFFVSGYLFFAKYNKFGWCEYKEVVKRKFWTLAVPYLLWTIMIYYPYNLMCGDDVLGKEYGWMHHLYHVFWSGDAARVETSIFGYKFSTLSVPIGLGVLWFVRDLMVVMALSPIFWWIIRRLKMWSVLVFLLPYLLHIGVPLPIQGFGFVALCFFPFGAVFSICGRSMIDIVRRYGNIILSWYLLLLIIGFILDIISLNKPMLLSQSIIIFGIGAMFYVSYLATMYSSSAQKVCLLGEASFFIYIVHATPFFNFLGHINDYLYNGTWWGPLVAYVFTWGFRILVCTSLYFAMKKSCPKLLSVLVGGRISSSRDVETGKVNV